MALTIIIIWVWKAVGNRTFIFETWLAVFCIWGKSEEKRKVNAALTGELSSCNVETSVVSDTDICFLRLKQQQQLAQPLLKLSFLAFSFATDIVEF